MTSRFIRFDHLGNVIEEFVLPDPEPTPEEVARASAVAKLRALGLTEAEALALVGGTP
jgi:hypothetical protein